MPNKNRTTAPDKPMAYMKESDSMVSFSWYIKLKNRSIMIISLSHIPTPTVSPAFTPLSIEASVNATKMGPSDTASPKPNMMPSMIYDMSMIYRGY